MVFLTNQRLHQVFFVEKMAGNLLDLEIWSQAFTGGTGDLQRKVDGAEPTGEDIGGWEQLLGHDLGVGSWAFLKEKTSSETKNSGNAWGSHGITAIFH